MLNEADTRAKLIDPKLHEAGWKESFISREYYITDGRIGLVGDTHVREERKKADYILRYAKSLPIAVVEAKDESHSPLDGIQQAKDYAEMLGVTFAYPTNGHGIEEFDFITNQQMSLERFPRPEELWNRYVNWKKDVKFLFKMGEPGVTWRMSKDPLLHPYYHEPGGKKPRYYQETAIREIIEAILKGRKRILLAMATGTGKTFVAFQIAWKLVKPSWPLGPQGRMKMQYRQGLKFKIPNPKSQIPNSKFQIPNPTDRGGAARGGWRLPAFCVLFG
ncbi:MAG TPA: hypothetical protein EYP21_01955, partial [Syntrophaceae bacterium]|nr:hypothetical protein [Syntrophaceae bacterium]